MSREFEQVAAAPGLDEEEDYREYDDSLIYDGLEDAPLDLRQEIFAQMKLLRAVRKSLFTSDGRPHTKTDYKEIRSYMSSSSQLLTLLQKVGESLKTDTDIRKIEMAVEMAMEEAPCPEFVESLKKYLSDEDL